MYLNMLEAKILGKFLMGLAMVMRHAANYLFMFCPPSHSHQLSRPSASHNVAVASVSRSSSSDRESYQELCTFPFYCCTQPSYLLRRRNVCRARQFASPTPTSYCAVGWPMIQLHQETTAGPELHYPNPTIRGIPIEFHWERRATPGASEEVLLAIHVNT